MKDLISRVARMLTVDGITVDDIHGMLKDEGMSEYEAYLTYIAGKMLYQSREANDKPNMRTAATIPSMKKVNV